MSDGVDRQAGYEAAETDGGMTDALMTTLMMLIG